MQWRRPVRVFHFLLTSWKTTVIDWRSYFREMCSTVVDQQMANKIGGAGFTVEIDETFVFTRKSHKAVRSRMKTQVHWCLEAFVVKLAMHFLLLLRGAIT